MSGKVELRKLLLRAVQDAVQMPLEGENLFFDRQLGQPWGGVHIAMGPTYAATLGEEGTDGLSGFVQVDLHYPLGQDGDLEKKTASVLDRLHVGRRLTATGVLVDLGTHGKPRDSDGSAELRRSLTVYWTGRLPR